MSLPDRRTLVLNEGILSEATGDDHRIVLWLPGSRHKGFQEWERISSLAGAEIQVDRGVRAVEAAAIRARQPIRGFLGKLVQRFRKSRERSWTLPVGESAKQVGERRRGLWLVWSEVDADSLDEARIKSCWAGCQVQKLGLNLYLASGVESPPIKNKVEAVPALPEESPVRLAEQSLATGRRANDRRKEAAALTDLGILLTHQGNARRAIALLEEALTLVRQQGDQASESDILNHLGLAMLASGQPKQALALFQQGHESARASGEPFAKKMALFHLGLVYSAERDLTLAFTYLEQALDIARQVGDRQHEADLLWQLGVVHAEAGQRDQSVARCQEAVGLFKQMGNPQVDWLESQLHKFRAREISMSQAGVGFGESNSSPIFGGPIFPGDWIDQGLVPGKSHRRSGPGLLRMAFSAMKSMARFSGSGFIAAPADAYQKRLQTCEQCPYHTGLRCKLCGCFTRVKAWMPYETCPIGKWAG